MPARIKICLPCAAGQCSSCTDPDCVCRHGPAAMARAAERPPTRPTLPPVPQSAPFELDHALADAREAGRAEGYDAGYLEGHATALAELAVEPYAALVELDANGGLVALLACGDLDHLALRARAWEPAMPGAYVEAWAPGRDEPIDPPAAKEVQS